MLGSMSQPRESPPGKPDSAPGPKPSGGAIILYSAADLLWATRIKETAAAMGIPSRPVRSVEMLEARLGDSEVCGLIIDLEAGEVGMQLIGRLRRPDATPRERALPIVVFGPHVAAAQLEAARQAGASVVMARGAFSANLPRVLESLARGQSGTLPSTLTE